MSEILIRLIAEATKRQDAADEEARNKKAENLREAVRSTLGGEVLAAFDELEFGHDLAGSFATFNISTHTFMMRQSPLNADFLISLTHGVSPGTRTLIFLNLKDENARDRVLREIGRAIASFEQEPRT